MSQRIGIGFPAIVPTTQNFAAADHHRPHRHLAR